MTNKSDSQDPISFEEAFERLEQVVRQLEDGQLGLSESLARYEEGVRYLKLCHQALASAERKIELLVSVDEAGQVEAEAFVDEASGEQQKPKARSRRRSQTPTAQADDGLGGDVDTQRGLF